MSADRDQARLSATKRGQGLPPCLAEGYRPLDDPSRPAAGL